MNSMLFLIPLRTYSLGLIQEVSAHQPKWGQGLSDSFPVEHRSIPQAIVNDWTTKEWSSPYCKEAKPVIFFKLLYARTEVTFGKIICLKIFKSQ